MAEKNRGVRGQALIETAIALPIVLLLIATVIDCGMYVMAGQSVLSAADSVARQAEANEGMTQAEAQAYLETNYPNLTGAQVTLGAPVRTSEALPDGYKVWVESEGTFKTRPTEVGWDKRSVQVTYTGSWTTPVTMTVSGIVVGSPTYDIAKSATAINDATFETW